MKETVFPFAKFPGSDVVLGPEMLSTGEVMGCGRSFAEAYLKAQIAAANQVGDQGYVFFGVHDDDKPRLLSMAQQVRKLGYPILATAGTAAALRGGGIPSVEEIALSAAASPSLVEYLRAGKVALVINTTLARRRLAPQDLRRLVLTYHTPYCTTLEAASTLIQALSEKVRFQYQPLTTP